MSKAGMVLDELKKELENDENELLANICDICHWPYVAGNEEVLQKHCDECYICGDLQTLIKKHRTVAVGEVMAIAAQEITPKKEI